MFSALRFSAKGACVAAALAGSLGLVQPAAASLVGVAVGAIGDDPATQEVGVTEFRSALGADAIRYFIPLGDADGVYGVGGFGLSSDSGDGGGVLTMFLAFSPIVSGLDYTLDILFEDLDLAGANDPTGFLETVDVLNSSGVSLVGGPITDISSAVVAGNADTQQLLSLALGALTANPFYLKLTFSAAFTRNGTNTAEFLVATLTPVPLPAALPLFLTGLAGLGFAGRIRRKAAS